MIKARQLVYEFDLKFNRFNSGKKNSLDLVDKVYMLNEALGIYFEKLVEFAEYNSETENALSELECKNEILKKITPKSDSIQDVFKLEKEVYKILRIRVIANKKGCGDKSIIAIKSQSDDLEGMMSHEYWKSSFEWEQILFDKSKDGLHFYHQGEMNIKSVHIDYIRKPKDIHAPSLAPMSNDTGKGEYIDWCGEVQKNDCHLEICNHFAHRKIVDIAIVIARINAGDNIEFQAKIQEILFKNSPLNIN